MKEDEKHVLIQGAGGGKKQKSPPPPKEAPNTLQSASTAKVLDLLAYGPIKGVVGGAKGVYLDDTVVQNENGSFNFDGINLSFRDGEPDQDIIEGFNEVSSIREINTELRYGVPISRTVTNKDATSVLVTVKLGGLLSRDAKSGDTNPYQVPFSIIVRKDGAVYDSISTSIQGKTTSAYERTYRLNLPPSDSSDVTVVVQRSSKESESQNIIDAISWSKLAEAVDAKHNYPGCALVGFEVDARLFGETLPSRKYLTDLSIVQIPSNYNPYTRQYTGLWDGSMKWDWTDNPAWCFYDLATHPVIGAGVAEVNKFALYEIGKYCDELVDDGFGGKEPRFTCNTVFTDTADAINALSTLASVFRGMAYWGSDTVEVVADMPGPVRRIISPSDVVDGAFEYSGTSLKERHSVALVQWNDPSDSYDAKPEVVELPEAIAAIGYKEIEVTAVACTSRGQARRLGLWLLYSEHYETQMVTFEVTVKNADLRPGDFIAVSDPYRAGARLAGKILEVDRVGQWVTLDDLPSEEVVGWDLTVEGDDKSLSRSKITAVNTELKQVRVASLSPKVFVGAGFSLTSGAVGNQQFRVLSVTENDRHNYIISASEHHPGKYDYVEKGLKLPELPTTMLPSGVLSPPTGLSGESYTKLVAGILHQNATISWEPSPDPRATKSALDGKGPQDIAYKTLYTGDGTSFDVENIDPGSWQFRVRAFSETFGMSAWHEKTIHLADGLQPIPPISLILVPQTFSVSITPVKQGYTVSEFEFWRSSAPLTQEFIESNASLLGTSSGSFYDDTVTFDSVYYYYVRAVNAYGKSAFVAGQTRTLADVEDILGALASEANEGPLGQWFNQEIDKIGGDGPGSVNDRIGGVVGRVTDLQTNVDGLNDAISDAEDRLTVDIDAVSARTDTLDQSVAGLQATVVGLDSDLQTSVGNLNDAISDAEDRLTVDIGTVSARTDTLDQSVAGLQAAVSDLDGDLQSSVADLNDALEDVDSHLTGRIENVAGDIAGLGTSISDLYGQVVGLDDDLQGSVSDLNSQLSQLETQISDITGSEDWEADQVYLAGSLVWFDDALYRAEQDAPAGTPVTNEVYWRKVGDYLSLGEAVAALTIQVTDMQVHVDEVLAERLLLIDAQIGDTSAQLSSLEQAFASETEATAGRIDQLAVDLGTTTTGLQQEIQTRATETSALASDVQSIQAALGDVASVEAFDGLVVRVDQMGDDITGVSQSVTDLTSRTANTETDMGVISTAVEGLETSVGLIEGELTAQAGQLTALGVSIGEVGDLAEQADGKADDALLGLGDKADASAVQGLTVEVEQLGEDIAANSGLITQLEGSVQTAQGTADDALAVVATKADASAVQALTIEVEQIGDTTEANSGLITQLESSVSTAQGTADDALLGLGDKADASALQSLTTEVERIDGDVTANADAVTQLAGRIETAESGIAGNAGALESLSIEVSDIDGEVAAVAQRLGTLETSVGETSAALSVLQQAFSDESEATASQLTALASELGTTSAGLASEIQTRASETAALASDVQSLQAALEDVASVEAFDALVVEVEQLGEDITGVAQSVTDLTSRITDTETGMGVISTAVEGLQTSVGLIEGELSAQASDITALGVSIGEVGDLAEQADGKADDALLGLGDKADASAVQALTIEVEQIGDTTEANSGLITQLESSVSTAQGTADDALAGLGEKADSSAVQALTTEVERIGEDLSTASQSITDLGSTLDTVSGVAEGAAGLAEQADSKAGDALQGLSTKADASALQALTTEVGQVGEDVSVNAEAITDLGSRIETAETGIAGNAGALESLNTEVAEIDGKVAAAAQRLTALETEVGDTSATLSVLQQAFSDESEATSSQLASLAAELGTTSAGLASEIQTRATETAALASDVQSMQAVLEGVATSEALQVLTVEVEQLGSDITSVAQSVTSLTGRIESTETGLQGVSDAVSGLQTSVSDIEGDLSAQASDITGLGVSIGQAADLAEQADGKADDALLGLGDKADASALQALTTEVEQVGEDVLANSGSITQLNSSVEAAQQAAGDALAGLVDKADASALQALTTEVQQIDEDLSTASQSITNLDASLQVVGTTAQGAADLAAQADGKADDALSGLGDKADSSAVQALTTEVNQIGEDLSAASQSITDLGSTLSAVSDVADDALEGLLTKADSSAVQALTTEVEQIGEDVTANSGAIAQLGGRLESAETGIVGNADAVESLTTEVELIGGEVTAAAEQVSRLSVELRPERADGEKADSLEGWRTKVEFVERARSQASENEALGSYIRALEAHVEKDVLARIQTEEVVRATQTEALATQLSTIQAAVSDDIAVVLTQDRTARIAGDEALASDISLLSVGLTDESAERKAAILSEQNARVAGDEASTSYTNQQISSLKTTVNDETDVKIAAVQTDINTKTGPTGALAQSISTLQTTVNGHTSSIQTVSETTNSVKEGLNSMWGVKLVHNSATGKQEVAGVGLNLTSGSAPQSEFIVRANRFTVLNNTGGAPISPFTIANGQVIIQSALIGDATITMAKIGGDLRSTTYVAGQVGWRLQKNGNFEINGNTPGQGRITISNTGIIVRDSANRIRVRLGKLN